MPTPTPQPTATAAPPSCTATANLVIDNGNGTATLLFTVTTTGRSIGQVEFTATVSDLASGVVFPFPGSGSGAGNQFSGTLVTPPLAVSSLTFVVSGIAWVDGQKCAFASVPSAPATMQSNNHIPNPVLGLPRVGSALKTDAYHSFSDIIDNYAAFAAHFVIPAENESGHADEYQIYGSLNGTEGVFEWIVQDEQVTHRFFRPGGTLNGDPSDV